MPSTLESFSSDRRASIEQSRFLFLEPMERVHERPQSELFSFLSQMKLDLSAQDQSVMTEVPNLNTKIESLS